MKFFDECIIPMGEDLDSGGEGSFENESSYNDDEPETFDNLDYEEYEDGDDSESSKSFKSSKKSKRKKTKDDDDDDDDDDDTMPETRSNKKEDNKSKKIKKDNSDDDYDDDEIEYIKAKYSENDYDLHPDSEFMLDEDGETVPLRDLLDGYRQYKDYDEKFNSFEDEKENLSKDRRNYQDTIDNANMINREYSRLKYLAQKNPTESFFEVLDHLGVNSQNGFKALTETLFPRRNSMDEIERFTLSVGLSFAVTSLVGLFLSLTPFGLTLTTALLSLGSIVIVLSLVALNRKYKAEE